MLCTSKQLGILRKGITGAVLFSFLLSSVIPPQALYAQNIPTVLNLPIPGTMITPSPGYNPVIVKGINLYPENPLQFDFLVDKGGTDLDNEQLKIESQRLIKYFLASLTTPEEEMWVNLSPYEKDRIIPKGFGETEMGRDLLAQDYILKQLTSSLMYPEDELGTEFWDRVYKKANEKFGATEIPVDTFNKVWIVAEKAVVFEKGTSAFILETHLKVMLEEDYVAAQHSGQWSVFSGQKKDSEPLNTELSTDHRALTTQIIRQIIIPEIEKEVNEGKNFSSLRQIYNSLILATWFKNKLKKAAEKGYAPFLGMVYADQNKTRGIDVDDKQINQKIYSQYLEAFKKGVYDYVKEDFDPVSQQIIPRKYFSGGAVMTKSADGMMLSEMINDQALLVNNKLKENFSEEADGASWFSVVNNPILKDSAMIGKISEWLASSDIFPIIAESLRIGL